ncbi:hypothetical protein ISF_00410 [Cordyceps fumosorosea ARSEF 2679]|uniref:Uncharacterized protein n=1 Tax=Cordyceps fumosorosea (strain ARSEF 2679) TaxID=1081104 RepID=A0A162N0D8_CORFA|nr:hypothetical protein ISF_00410 [Cordyceps fumosorosea ARSEF 2679]OAA73509.1 hypothetical protein ISF_00410 [Cordyceps fumosorosea ARSEF 2679]
MSDKNEVSTTERVAPQPGKKAAFKRHCQRFWWLHLIIFILIAVLVILLTIFVAVPRIAQDKINHAKLDIVAVKISNATPNSYQMTINSTISTDGTVKANIDPFAGDMYLEDTDDKTPFAVLNFPATNANKHSNVNVDQHVEIKDMDAFSKFNTWFVNNETLRIGIKGKTKVQPSGLSRKYDVTFQKVLEVKGLNLFKGTKVIDPRVELKVDNGTDPNFRNFYARVELPNPSHFSLDIGNATFNNYFLGTNLGKLYINDLTLVPGNNILNVTGSLDQAQIIVLASSAKPYCETGVADFSLIGSNVTRDGAEIPYFQYALAHANQTVSLNITDTLYRSDIPAAVTCSKTASK